MSFPPVNSRESSLQCWVLLLSSRPVIPIIGVEVGGDIDTLGIEPGESSLNGKLHAVSINDSENRVQSKFGVLTGEVIEEGGILSHVSIKPESICDRRSPAIGLVVPKASCLTNIGGAKEEIDLGGVFGRGVKRGKEGKTTRVPHQGFRGFLGNTSDTTSFERFNGSREIGALTLGKLHGRAIRPRSVNATLLLAFVSLSGAIIDCVLLRTLTPLPMNTRDKLLELGEALKLVELAITLEMGGSDLLLLEDEVDAVAEMGGKLSLECLSFDIGVIVGKAPILPLGG